jgi:hypothetical protein
MSPDELATCPLCGRDLQRSRGPTGGEVRRLDVHLTQECRVRLI